MLDLLSVRPVFEGAEEPGFKNDRKKLETEPGMIIANHPGYIDPFLILSVLKRRDLLVMVHDNIYKSLERVIGREAIAQKFVSSLPQRENLKNIGPRITEHIKQGGAFLLFPTGMMHASFQGTFRHILQKMRAGDMVYNFYINDSDATRLQKDYGRYLGLASATLLPDASMLHSLLNLNRHRNQIEVRVEERYSEAKEWQELQVGHKPKEADDIFTRHFGDQFSSPKT